MLDWKQTEVSQQVVGESVINWGNIRLSVSPHPTDIQWQHFMLSFGEFNSRSHDECVVEWPREAIRIAREALDQLEAKIAADDTELPEVKEVRNDPEPTPAVVACQHEVIVGEDVLCGFSDKRPAALSCAGLKARDECPRGEVEEEPTPDAKPLAWETHANARLALSRTHSDADQGLRYCIYLSNGRWVASFDGDFIIGDTYNTCIAACERYEHKHEKAKEVT